MERIEEKTKEYNKLPVFYCKVCGSLLIIAAEKETESDYCGKCKRATVGITNIDKWKMVHKKDNNSI